MNRFKANPAGIRALGRDATIAVPLMARAQMIAGDARQLCPSRRVAAEIRADAPGLDAAGVYVRVTAYHWASAFVEFGTMYQGPSAMLRRAAERGGKFNGLVG